MFKFLNLQPEIFGVDVNDLSLRVVKLVKSRKGFKLASYNELALRAGIINEGVIQDQDALANALKKACSGVKGKKLETKHAIVSLPEEKSFSQVISLPRMSQKELKLAVGFEAENYIPLPMEKVYLDFQTIGSLPKEDAKHMDVLINVMPKTIVDSYVACFKKAGLKPCIMEVESQAIVRALAPEDSGNHPVIFIDFSQTKTSFIIFSANSIRFTCSIPISSGQLTDAIAKNLQISRAKAEELKIKHGLVTRKGDKNHAIVAAMDPILSALAEQIKKYISFYQGHTSREYFASEGNIEKIVLCGGGANLQELPDFLHKKLRIPVEIGNPFIHIAKEAGGQQKIAPHKALSFTTALGLALRGAGQSEEL